MHRAQSRSLPIYEILDVDLGTGVKIPLSCAESSVAVS